MKEEKSKRERRKDVNILDRRSGCKDMVGNVRREGGGKSGGVYAERR